MQNLQHRQQADERAADLDLDNLDLGARLSPLLNQGVMIVASGNVVHNLRRLEWTSPGSGFDWARRFDDAARDRVRDDPSDLGRLRDHPDYAASVPTPEHFLPLAYLAGVATRLGAVPNVLIDGCSMGSLSMMAYILKPAATESSVRSDGQEQH